LASSFTIVIFLVRAGSFQNNVLAHGNNVSLTAVHLSFTALAIHEEIASWTCAGDHVTLTIAGLDAMHVG